MGILLLLPENNLYGLLISCAKVITFSEKMKFFIRD